MEAISRSCLPEAAARTKRQRKATCCGVLGAASHRTTCSRSSAAKLTSGLILAMRTHISYWPQYVYLFMIHTTRFLRVPRSHTNIVLSFRVSALTRYREAFDKRADSPNISPGVSQRRLTFLPSGVLKKNLARPSVKRYK